MKTVYAFDFDGTLTTRDTLPLFIAHARGSGWLMITLVLFLPLIVLMRLGLMANWRVKQLLFSYCFRDMAIGEFDELCRSFARSRRDIIRPAGMECVRRAHKAGHAVYIVSASIDRWVRPFFEHIPVNVLGTQVEVEEGRLTGRFLTANCYGQEKLRRLREELAAYDEFTLIAYGDSRGDRELLAAADEAHYKPFR